MEGSGRSSGGSREYCLRWNNHQTNMVSFLSNLLPKESFADVTLVSAEGTQLQAHRIILSACSPYFEGVFENNPCKHPVVILKDVQYVDLRAIVSFIYNGEVNIEVDRINEIIQTAAALQVKGLAEVPADEFKRVSLAGRSSSPVDNGSLTTSRSQPPPLMMTSGRAWQSGAEANDNDFPARKKLKKSASANIPFSSGSSSTNGDVTNSNGGSFESGMGTSVSRSVDEGIGSDVSPNDQAQSSGRPGPPPLTAANAIIPKSRSLDDGYQRKTTGNTDGSSETGGYADQSGMDNEEGALIGNIGKRRRQGRPLLRQHRIKRLDHESSPGGGRDDGGGFEEQGYSSDTGETPITKTSSSSSCFEPQQQHYHHQGRSASVEHEMYSTTSTIPRAHSTSPSPQIKPAVPIVMVSQCSPTPPGSPQHISSPKSEDTNNVMVGEQSHTLHHPLRRQSSLTINSSTVPSGNSTASQLLTVPVEASLPITPTLRLAGPPQQQGPLVKQVSQPLLPSHHYHSSEDEAGPSSSSSSNPVIRRQYSQPIQSSTRPYPSYSIVGRGQLFHILKSDQFARDEESAAYLVESPVSPMLQFLPTSAPKEHSSTSGVSVKEVASSSAAASPQSHVESMSITLREVGGGPIKSLSSDNLAAGVGYSSSGSDKPHLPQQSSAPVATTTKESLKSSETLASLRSGLTEGQLVHRSGHCPALRPGPALGCNFCWNSVDSCGRVLRRKTKYFCPECHINLCIVPCFQEYHEKSDRKKKARTKLGLPKPSSM